jgi:hypothetical protein
MSMNSLSTHYRHWILAVLLGGMALCIYGVIAGRTIRYPSIAPYYLQLAESLTHGEAFIQPSVNTGYDLIQRQERWYVAQQPLPALLILPIVAVVGVEHVSDTAIQILIGALNVALCSLTLSWYFPELQRWRHIALVVFFAFGTVHASVTTVGGVWFFGHITAVTFTWLYLIALRWRHALWMGLCVGLVLLARTSVVPALLVLSAGCIVVDVREQQGQRWHHAGTSLVGFFLGLLPAVIFLATYNAVRFGHPLDFGYDHLVDAAIPHAKRLAYGTFHPVFLAENLYVAFIKPLIVRPNCLGNGCNIVTPSLEGTGILWTSPLMFTALLARPMGYLTRSRLLLIALAAVLALLPALLYHNTGAAQFGYRFLLDALPLFVLLVGAASQQISRWLWLVLLVYGIVINLWGAVWFINAVVYGQG